MKRNIIILLALIALFAMSVVSKPYYYFQLNEENILFNEIIICNDTELSNITGQFLANEIGNIYVGSGIF